MDKRYQVFISSTFLDLREERQAVSQALLRSDCFPAQMENWPAMDAEQMEAIKQIIDESDYFVVISAGKYGSVNSETGLSYTEMEYDYAVEIGKPIIRLLHKDPFDVLSANQVEDKKNTKRKLEVFREKMKSDSVASFWGNVAELERNTGVALEDLKRNSPSAGWVRSSDLSNWSRMAAGPSVRLQKFLVNHTEVENSTLVSVSLDLRSKANLLASYFDRLIEEDPFEWEFSKSADFEDFASFIRTDTRRGAITTSVLAIEQAFDERQAAIYFASIHELTSKIIGAPSDTIKAMAKLSDRQFKVGIMRVAGTIVVVHLAIGVGGAGTAAIDGLRDHASQATQSAAEAIVRKLEMYAREDGETLGVEINEAPKPSKDENVWGPDSPGPGSPLGKL